VGWGSAGHLASKLASRVPDTWFRWGMALLLAAMGARMVVTKLLV